MVKEHKTCSLKCETLVDEYQKNRFVGRADAFVKWCERFEKYFEENEFCAGKEMSYADFNLFELLDCHKELLNSDCFQKYPKICQFISKIENLEKIKAYRSSDRFFKRPCNNASARFK